MRLIEAQESKTANLPRLQAKVTALAGDEKLVANLLGAMHAVISDRYLGRLAPLRGLAETCAWKRHVEDAWDQRCIMNVVTFALGNPRIRVLRVPPLSRIQLLERDKKIREQFKGGREAGVAAGKLIEELADSIYLSTKQIEGIIYRPE